MSTTLTIGPLALPIGLLWAIASVIVAVFAARRAAGSLAGDAERQLLRILLLGVVASRIGFVARFHDAYLQAPLTILDIRDGGWDPIIGLIVATLYAGVRVARIPALRKALVAGLASGALLWVAGDLAFRTLDTEGMPMPALATTTLQGQAVELTSFRGRPTVVNLWATWCPPCRREMPVLANAQRLHQDVHFVFLNQGEAAASVERYLHAGGLELRNVLLDARGEAGARLGSGALPTTLFFDAEGRLVSRRTGELSAASLQSHLQSILPSPPR